MTELKHHQAARLEAFGRLRDQLRVKLVALFATVQRKFRLVIAHFSRQPSGFAPPDVWRILKQSNQKEATNRKNPRTSRILRIGCDPKMNVFPHSVCAIASAAGEISMPTILGQRQLFCEGNCNAAGTCAHVCDQQPGPIILVRPSRMQFAQRQPVQRDFDQMLGLRPRNQNVGSDFERQPPKLLFAREMLHRNAGNAPV